MRKVELTLDPFFFLSVRAAESTLLREIKREREDRGQKEKDRKKKTPATIITRPQRSSVVACDPARWDSHDCRTVVEGQWPPPRDDPLR